MSRDETIAGLRALADWLENHPDAATTSEREYGHYVLAGDDAVGIALVRAIAQSLGLPVTVDTTEAYCSVQFGGGISWVARYLYRERVREYDALMSYRGAVEVAR